MPSAFPDEWGAQFQRDGTAIAQGHAAPDSIHFTAPMHFFLILFTVQPERQIALNSDRRQIGLAPAGALEIIPQGSELFARWSVEKQNMIIAFDEGRLKRLAGVEFDNDAFDLRPLPLGTVDREALDLARRMRGEIGKPGLAHADYLDALTTLFGLHLLRHYSTLQIRAPRRLSGGLSPATWRRVNDFIQDNLSEKLSMERVAGEVQLSPGYFSRAFTRTTGQSPHQFIIALRLAQARRLIIETNEPLDDIARASGFSSHSHMTSLMSRTWGITPAELRRDRSHPPLSSKDGDDPQG